MKDNFWIQQNLENQSSLLCKLFFPFCYKETKKIKLISELKPWLFLAYIIFRREFCNHMHILPLKRNTVTLRKASQFLWVPTSYVTWVVETNFTLNFKELIKYQFLKLMFTIMNVRICKMSNKLVVLNYAGCTYYTKSKRHQYNFERFLTKVKNRVLSWLSIH